MLVLIRLALVTVGLVLALAGAEIGVRCFTRFEYTAPRIFAPSDLIPWELRKGARAVDEGYWGEFHVSIAVNAGGYRQAEFSTSKAPGTTRILVLGDSFTFGYGVEEPDAYPRVLETLLNSQGRRYEVINAGYASGYAPDTALVYFRARGRMLQPDVVILAFFQGNDIGDLRTTEWPLTDSAGLPLRVTSGLYYVDTQGRLRTTRGAFLGFLEGVPVLGSLKLIVRDHSQFMGFAVQQYRLGRIARGAPTGFDAPSFDRGDDHARLAHILTGLRDASRESGAQLIVFNIPEKGQQHGAGDFLRHWAHKSNVPLIDALKGDPSHYFRIDPHWTAVGHRAAAQALAAALGR